MTCLTFHLFHHYYSPLELLVSARLVFTCACFSLLDTVVHVWFSLSFFSPSGRNIFGQMSNFPVRHVVAQVVHIKSPNHVVVIIFSAARTVVFLNTLYILESSG